MTTPDFSQLKSYDPRGRKVWWPVPIEGGAELEVCYAGQTNKPYVNAVAKHNAKTGAARKVAAGNLGADVLEDSLNTDRKLFPLYVVSNWRKVKSADGKDVPFSTEACTAFLAALPSWIMQNLSRYCIVATNFLPDDMPDEADVADEAGK